MRRFFLLLVIMSVFVSCASRNSNPDVWEDAASVSKLQCELAAANERIRELESKQQSALTIIERADERFAEIGRISAAEGSTLSGIIERQRRIESLIAKLWTDYLRLKEELGNIGDSGGADGGTAAGS